MKKTTFYVLFALIFGVTSSTIAQTLNQNAAWPNANWTVMGTFNMDPTAFEADPTTTANFAFDDDDAGFGSDDDISAESPVIDLTAAYVAGETWLTVTADYTYNDLDDTLTLEYWDADGATWVAWEQFLGTADQPTDNFCSGARDSYTSAVLNISAFTSTQQSGFRYRISFLDDGGAGGDAYEWGFCFDAPTITSATPPSCPDPIALAVTNMMPTTAELSWTETGSAPSWDIELLDITGGDTVTGTPTDTGVLNPHTATGLVDGNDYEFYVRADCGGSGLSNWAGPFAFTHTPAPGNDDCANAIALTVNADYACGAVTAGTVAGATNSGVDNCGGTEDDDVWYSFMATEASHRVSLINISGSTTDMYHAVYDSTPGCGALGTAVICNDGNESNLTGLTPGTVYFVQVYTWTATPDQDSVFEVCVGTPPACVDVTGLNASNITETTADLGWTENGLSTAWNIDWGPAPYTQGTGTLESLVTMNPFTISGLTGETDYEFYVQSDCGGSTSAWVGPFAFTSNAAPPANDECANAIALTAGGTYTDNPLDGSLLGATNSGFTNTCGGTAVNDVWYSVVIPVDGNITLETGPDIATATPGNDTAFEVYTGDCGTLVSLDCDDDGAATGAYSFLDLTGLTPGSTLYIRLWGFGDDEFEPYSISAYNASLSIGDFESLGFSYYPNPVNNILTLNAQKDIDSIVVNNMLGQEVLRTNPNNMESNLDLSELQSGAYFVNVTIDNTSKVIRIIKN